MTINRVARETMSGIEYSEQVAEEVCNRVALGRSLNSVCSDEDMPNKSSFWRWMNEHDWLRNRYTRAREDRAEFLAEEILSIADVESDPNKARVRVDARKWAASKLDPKRYGDKLTLDGDMNLKIPDDQLESRLAVLLGKAGVAGAAGGKGEAEGEA